MLMNTFELVLIDFHMKYALLKKSALEKTIQQMKLLQSEHT